MDLAGSLSFAPSCRVLRVMTRLNIGGPARQELVLTRSLMARGYDTRLVSGDSGEREGRMPSDDGPDSYIPWLTREVRPPDDLRAYRALAGLMNRWNPQVVHTHMAKAGALGRLAASRARVPVIVHTFHGHVLQEYFGALKNAAFAEAERRLARRTDALLAVAPWVKEELLARGIGSEDQWYVVPVGVNMAGLLTNRPAPREARTKLGLPPAGSIVGCIGRLAPIKDHRTFLEAARLVARDHPDVTFVLAGDGELRSELERAGREVLGDRIRFLGWVDDLASLYAACDVVALTSRLEGTPVSLIEASAAGKPVVATDVGGVGEVVRNRHSGILAQPGDPIAIAANIATLLHDPDMARRMGDAGTRWVARRFSDQRLADDVDGLYRQLLALKGVSIGGAAYRSHDAPRMAVASTY
jgi:glycosyltransferase involved in cell wall biosynthesis